MAGGKHKVFNTIVDILLITTAFAATDIIMAKVFHSENLWLELGTYIVFYAVVFGIKRGIGYLWNKFKMHKAGEVEK